jgi:hypothetical protein
MIVHDGGIVSLSTALVEFFLEYKKRPPQRMRKKYYRTVRSTVTAQHKESVGHSVPIPLGITSQMRVHTFSPPSAII